MMETRSVEGDYSHFSRAGVGMRVIQSNDQNHNRTVTTTITKKYIVAEPRRLLSVAGAEAGI